ncbi:Titin [Echinococcus granulosus]|uniref:Titin n=1 Tax=Echinococcus granulosus TaxID=6210 RepID=W6UMW7_ECHGR|nr:Titin [Echinococcus granulosus]EUB59472.1 Titin [Echinococcus granulosus]
MLFNLPTAEDCDHKRDMPAGGGPFKIGQNRLPPRNGLVFLLSRLSPEEDYNSQSDSIARGTGTPPRSLLDATALLKAQASTFSTEEGIELPNIKLSFWPCLSVLGEMEFPPAFHKEMESVDAVNGTPAVLTCQLNRSLSPSEIVKLSWLKMPRQLLARGRMKITTNERISIVPQASENVFQLRFDPVVKEDGGEYRCVYNHKTGVKYKVVVVNIQVQPKVDIDPRGELELLEGEYAFVVCNASGTPYPQFRWWMLPLSTYHKHCTQQAPGAYGENEVTVTFVSQMSHNLSPFSLQPPTVPSTSHLALIPVHEIASKYKQNIFVRSGKLIINAVNRDMTGWYFCEAHNSVKPSAIEHALLTVHYAPRVFLPQREVFFAPYGNVSLVCEFQAFPLTEVEWLLDGRRLDTPACERRGHRATSCCTVKTIEGLPYHTSEKWKHGFGDSLNNLNSHTPLKKEASTKSPEQFRNINLTQSSNDLTLYGRRVRSVLHVWVTEARQFGRYSCRMQTRYGLAEGFIRLRNKGRFLISSTICAFKKTTNFAEGNTMPRLLLPTAAFLLVYY